MNRQTATLLILLGMMATAAKSQHETGTASFYHDWFDGKTTSNGETFRQSEMTAAHKSLPFNSLVEVTRLDNGKSVIVRVNDRGPFIKGRVIDLSRAAAQALDMERKGLAAVSLRVLESPGRAALADRQTAAPPASRPNTSAPAAEPPRAAPATANAATPATAPAPADAFAHLQDAMLRQRGILLNADMEALPLEGYAWQLAAYAEPYHLERHLRALMPRHMALVFVDERPVRPLHKVMVGPFPTVQALDRFLNQWAGQPCATPGGLLVNLQALRP